MQFKKIFAILFLVIYCLLIKIPNSVYAQNYKLLLPNRNFYVASYNTDGYCTNEGKQVNDACSTCEPNYRGCPLNGGAVPWKDSLITYTNSGKKFDIIGFQEAKHTSDTSPSADINYFKNVMETNFNLKYNCIASKKTQNWKGNVLCTLYKIDEASFLTIDNVDRSFTDCVKIITPAGMIIFCNSHPVYTDAIAKFKQTESWILNEVITAYTPQNLTIEEKSNYRRSLLARTILVGDMNAYYNQIGGKFLNTCPNPDIDHVMYLDMARSDVSGIAPFNTTFLVPEPNGCKTTVEKWPTDHGGPVVAKFTTKELTINLSTNPENYNDLNNDGTTNLADVLILIMYIFNSQKQILNPKAIVDVNFDSDVNILDVIELLREVFQKN